MQEEKLFTSLSSRSASNWTGLETLEVVVPYQLRQAAQRLDSDASEAREWPWLKLKMACTVRGVRFIAKTEIVL